LVTSGDADPVELLGDLPQDRRGLPPTSIRPALKQGGKLLTESLRIEP
jgi:hypothetical protein